MENQHRKIDGYRELSQAEIELMNEVTAKGAEIGVLCEKVRALSPRPVRGSEQTSQLVSQDGKGLNDEGAVWTDPRWCAIAQTHFQEGLQALKRAITRPSFF